MTRDGKIRPGKGRKIARSSEDQELWEHATRDLARLNAKPRVGAVEVEPGAVIRERRDLPAPAADGIPKQVAPAGRAAKPIGHAPPSADFDHRLARKLASGRRTIDARIDLHGMRQAQAHAALRNFLLGCHADGLSFVLVITGKGAAATRADDQVEFGDNRKRGILRDMVPGWLAEPELRVVVVGHRAAGRQHGGEGALYVQLRRRRA